MTFYAIAIRYIFLFSVLISPVMLSNNDLLKFLCSNNDIITIRNATFEKECFDICLPKNILSKLNFTMLPGHHEYQSDVDTKRKYKTKHVTSNNGQKQIDNDDKDYNYVSEDISDIKLNLYISSLSINSSIPCGKTTKKPCRYA